MQIKDYSLKKLGAILYKYYIENYCEDEFSFDKGKLRNNINKYIGRNISNDEFNELSKSIQTTEREGSDYDNLVFQFEEIPNFFFQVTSLIDYKGNYVEGYNGREKWADVGMFFINYEYCEFDDLND